MNQVTLLGNLTADPELSVTNAGQDYTKFSLAVNRRWKDSDGNQQEKVMFVDCIAWNQAKLIADTFRKGSRILINGELEQNRWETDDGQKRSKHQVRIFQFHYIDKRGEVPESTSESEPVDDDATEDDVPF